MRLIDADALLPYARRLIDCAEDDGVERCFRINAVEVAAINAAPTIDAEPVRHGRWEWKGGAAYCTAHKGCISPHNYGYGYCPLCGAKMDGGKQDAD